MRHKMLFCALATVLVAAVPAHGQDGITHNVYLTVSADEEVQGRAESYVLRELRSIPDVNVVRDRAEADWLLELIIMEVRTKARTDIGYSIATIGARNDHLSSVELATFVDPDSVRGARLGRVGRVVSRLTSGSVSIEMFDLRTTGTDAVRAACRQVVADFDADVLEESREAYQRIIDKMDEQ